MKRMITGLMAATLFASGVASADITVGGKNFTEQQILASMTDQYLQAKGYDVDKRAGMGSAVVRRAQENGQIDLYWEYTGTSLITYNKVTEKLSPEDTYQRVKSLDAEKGLVWLNPSDANNTYALTMRSAEAEAKGIESISDLAGVINGGDELTFASNAEFYAREDGLRPLQKTYEFEFGRPNIKRMDFGLTLPALRDEQVDVSIAYSTDGRIPAYDLVTLEDDKDFFPAYALTPVVRQETLDENPELADQMNALSALLNDDTMASLNASVDVDGNNIEDVAHDFLEQHDLL